MTEFVSRPHIRPPSSTIAFDPPHVLRSTSTASTPALPLPRPSVPFGQLSDYSIRTNDARTLATFSIRSTSIPPITHVKDSVRGLQTPPPEMTTAEIRPPAPHSSSHGYFKPFDNPVTSSEVSRTLERMRSVTQQQQQKPVYQQPTSPSRRVSVYNAQTQQPPQPTRRRNSTIRTGAAMIVPASINSTKGAIADFAAQVHLQL
jgi:hypothetical protein